MGKKDIIYIADYLIIRRKKIDLLPVLKANCSVMKL